MNSLDVQLIFIAAVCIGTVAYFSLGCGILIGLVKATDTVVFNSIGQIWEMTWHFGIFWPKYVLGDEELP